jgi:hypothetical protein
MQADMGKESRMRRICMKPPISVSYSYSEATLVDL